MKSIYATLLSFFIFIHFSAYSQSDSSFLNKAETQLVKYNALHPTEKVYLHLDKPQYNIGDTIWFKAYTVVGEKHQLSALSGVLYAELINPKDSVIKRLTLPLASGTAWGDFIIPRSNKPGSYHIRAYTNWMRNAGPGYFYNHALQIGGVQLSSIPLQQARVVNPDVQFFPEGGELVNGIRSKVAVKCVNASGLGEDIKGTIVDNDGNIVADFNTQHLGMGIFALTPQSGKTYKAKINGPNENGFSVNLPKALEEGYSLSLNSRQKDSIYVKIAVNEKLFKEKQRSGFFLVAQSGGKVYYTAAGKLESSVFTSAINNSRFPTGIVQFTLFSERGEPMNERIVFIQKNDTLKLNIKPLLATYTARQPVTVNVDARDNINNPAVGSFSVAVINESRVGTDENNESTIINNLLLTSELKGNIEQPNYYFSNVNEQKKADLDVLMLTQGYHRFEWKQVLSNTTPIITYQPERLLEVTGTLKTPSGKPVPNGKITLMSTRENILIDTVTDMNGNFKFDDLYLSDTSKIVLRARKAHNGSNVAIYIQQPDYPPVIKRRIETPVQLSPELAAIMRKSFSDYRQQQKDDSLRNGRQLKEVNITAGKIAKPDIYNNYGTVKEYDVNMKQLATKYSNIKDALLYVIPGLTYINGKYYYGGRTSKAYEVGFNIDGLDRTAEDLNYFSPPEVESIRMIDRADFNNPTLRLNTKRYAGTDTASHQLKLVTIRGNKIKKEPDLSTSSNLHGGGNADQVIMGDKLGSCVNISDCLTSKISGVIFSNKGIPVNTRGGKMSVIIDGVIFDGSHLNDVSATDIYSIEVLRSGFAKSIYGSSIDGGGALVVTTKRGADNPTYTTADTTVLKQVDIKAKKPGKKPDVSNSANLNGGGNADQVIMGDKIEGCITLSDCLNGKIMGVTFKADGTPHSTRVQPKLSGDLDMVIIVDGNIMEGSRLNELDAGSINSIEVLRSSSYLAIYGSNAPGGALVITTKRGSGSSYVTSEKPAGLISYPFKGFYKARAFYLPKYTASKTSSQAPDLRNTIYWNPNLITDKGGQISFQYFNNDTRGIYRVVIEGIDDNGNLGRQVYRYKVE